MLINSHIKVFWGIARRSALLRTVAIDRKGSAADFAITLSFLRCAMLQRGTTIVIQYIHANGAWRSIRRRDDDGLYQIWQDNVLEGWARNTTIVPSRVYSARWAKPRKSS